MYSYVVEVELKRFDVDSFWKSLPYKMCNVFRIPLEGMSKCLDYGI
jgi:hypothetical protein